MNQLKKRRRAACLSQKQLAVNANISVRQYRRIENCENIPRASTALLLAQSLGTTVEELFPGYGYGDAKTKTASWEESSKTF